MTVNRHQDPASKRQEEFNYQVLLARGSDEAMKNAPADVQEAAKNQAAFSERRKKYLGGK